MKARVIGAIAVATIVGLPTAAWATANVSVARLAGENRYATAKVIAENDHPSGALTAIVASGENYPDALAAAYLSGGIEAPIILTKPEQLSERAREALENLGVDGVTIVGGEQAVSQAVANQLASLGYTVERVQGPNRFQTAEEIATSLPPEGIGEYDPNIGRTAFVATGAAFADALAAGPISHEWAFPILLTRPGQLADAANGGLDTLEIDHVFLLGGADAVSATVEAQIEAKGIVVDRIAGANRMGTAADLADIAVDDLGFSESHVNLARGDFYADALAGGPHGGVEQSAILLTADPTRLSGVTGGWLSAHQATVSSIHVFGGPNAVSDQTVQDAREAAGHQG